MPIVYILTNESMPEIIKIGITENLERRVKELDNTSTPLPFECYYAVKVDDASTIEKKMHQGLDVYRVRQNREFFNTSPEKAKSFLEIAEIMGGRNVTPTNEIVNEFQDSQALLNAKKKRERFNFKIINIEPGTILEFIKDRTITCEVVDDTKVRFRGEVVSLSGSALTVIQEMGYDWDRISGPTYWSLNGETVSEIRRKNEM